MPRTLSMNKKPLSESAQLFWSAVWFIRRGPERDKADAVKVLRHVHDTTTGIIHDRADELLKGIDNGTVAST